MTSVLGEVHVHVTALRETPSYTRRRLSEEPISSSSTGNLQCLPDCACRCHNPAFVQVIPQSLVPYIGQAFFPKRLLRLPWSTLHECNVQTCRGDLKTTMPIRWLLPPGRVSVHMHISSPTFPIYLTVSVLRLVPRNASIWRMVGSGDVNGVRELFLARQASVLDVTEGGGSLVTVSTQNPCPQYPQLKTFSSRAEHGNKIPPQQS